MLDIPAGQLTVLAVFGFIFFGVVIRVLAGAATRLLSRRVANRAQEES